MSSCLLSRTLFALINQIAHTEKILTISSEFKMFLKIERHFKIENVFILLESS